MPRTLYVAAAVAAIVAIAPSPVHAQFGAIKKAAQKKIEEAAGKKAAGAAAGAATAAPATASTPASAEPSSAAVPQFDGTTLEVTPEVLGRFLVAMAAETPARAKMAKEKANEPRWRAQVDKYERCLDQRAEEQAAEQDSQDPKLKEAQLRLVRAWMAGDTVTARVLTDSLMTAGFQPDTTCGKRPVDAYKGIGRIENEERTVEGAGADAGEFSVQQYAVLKERVYPFVLAEKKGKPMKGGFTETEVSAMKAKKAELEAAFKEQLAKDAK